MNLSTKVKDFCIYPGITVKNLCAQMIDSGGFTSKKVGMAVQILTTMLNDTNCTKFLSFPACIVATGTRGVLRMLVEKKIVDVILTTCGTLDHDLARVWADYYHDDFYIDDIKLHKRKIHRVGNILIPYKNYGKVLEEKLQPLFEDIYNRSDKLLSTRELIWELGKRIDDKTSVVYWAAKNQIPMYVPGITDGAVGFQLWMFKQKHREFNMIDILKDEDELADIIFKSKRTGGIIIGGGISKHHTLWWNQFCEGLSYAIYLTTAVEYDGSLSGARVREAISWGKVRTDAQHVTVEGDATVLLPLIIGAVIS